MWLTACMVGATLAVLFLIGAVRKIEDSQYAAAVGAAVIGLAVGLPWLALPRPFAEATSGGMRIRRFGVTSVHPWREVDRVFVQQGDSELNLYLLTTTDDLTPVPLLLRFVSPSRQAQQVGEFLDAVERLRAAPGTRAAVPALRAPSIERTVLRAPWGHRVLVYGWSVFAVFIAGVFALPDGRTLVGMGVGVVAVAVAVAVSVAATRARVEVTDGGVRITALRTKLIPWTDVGRAVQIRKSVGARLALLDEDNHVRRLALVVTLPISYLKVRGAADAINRFRSPPATDSHP